MSTSVNTITAISTPPGLGGIAVLRVSGIDAREIVDRISSFKIQDSGLSAPAVKHAQIVDGAITVDDVVITWFQGPNSYTGEDVVEISCHGGRYAAKRILELLVENGAHHAKPGEFTERAFLNGKLDLAQAEAVAGLIHARTAKAGQAAARQLQGGLSEKIRDMRDKLLDLLALLELELDFSEEDVEFESMRHRKDTLDYLTNQLNELIGTFRRGRLVREGLRVALVGAPNAGKSTLLNAILQEDRAIVSPEPGTTRDVVEARIELDGIEVILQDTAGLRKSDHHIESQGIERTRKAIELADLILLLVDESEPIWPEEIIQKLLGEKSIIFVQNKVDLGQKSPEMDKNRPEITFFREIKLSALTHEGVDRLNQAIIDFLSTEDTVNSEIVVSEARHHHCLIEAATAIERAAAQLTEPTLMASDLRDAVNHFGEITGESVGESILDRIFSKFCIGK